ncbi:LysR family transcriptional regulator [Streptomyces nodosus]|uniref:LysR family transcriptional regulator n=1 Tax=Streptomyces nodosus TaxID=40318 RepID=A0A0B5DHD1_9ACTN|nr:LysR family transcriptional regulator [Streptomyces nodosus]AJE39412.1 LysR family transcriptional regulator [Streptomyces nodosus]MBB4790335.1 DNA-binding transcriptional LysR family regulator [Streptomyces nodosus]QEV37996.1 LysR family transcriptional regulator [Streptomyces nodosus]
MTSVELRQLRYFLAVAEELDIGRAAEHLLVTGPFLAQQLKTLERDLDVRLFDRDHRSMSLSPAGAALLPQVRALVERADDLRLRAGRLARSEPVRLGHVNWLPPDLTARTAVAAQLHVDARVAPSHAQAARVADGSLDVAVCWIRTGDLARQDLGARLIGADRLHAVSRERTDGGLEDGGIPARDCAVLLYEDTVSRASWNAFARRLSEDTGARAVRVPDGGVTDAAFLDQVRRSRRPVVGCPEDRTAPLPPGLVRRPLIAPKAYWTWSAVWRGDDGRTAVRAVVDALAAGVGDLGINAGDAWLPDDDLYKR